MNENSQGICSDAYNIFINNGKQWVFAIGIVIMITSLLTLTTFNNQIIPLLIRCSLAITLISGVRWVRYFFIITGFLSGLINLISAKNLFSLIGTNGLGMVIPYPVRNITSYDCYFTIIVGILNIVIALLLWFHKDIKAFYNSIRMKKTMQYIADNAQFANNENKYHQDTSGLSEKSNEIKITN